MTADERNVDPMPDVDGEPDGPSQDKAPDSSDVVEGPIGGASLREPSEIEEEQAGVNREALPDLS